VLIRSFHHVAIIASDYQRSKYFYTEILGLPIINEHYRAERNSYKLDLRVTDAEQIELFSFPDPPKRVSRPEAAGLRHLAFSVDRLEPLMERLTAHDIPCESIRIDEITGKRFTFFFDPDGLPLELYER
jgi:glyoxylase I family protein